ncbi:MAG TPA: 23S rRNA (uracil(1939)-C(5))-methyltransferase RlmD, partial [Ignavibacteriaceae bacterium]
MRKNDILKNITIENGASDGKCVARVNDQVIFVEKVAPGDVVDLRITRNKKTFLEGTPVAFHHYSESRVEPFCSHYGTCGGCKWQHIDYDYQLQFKQQQVIDNLQRIAKVQLPEISPIIRSKEIQYYRNKLEYTFTNWRWLTREEIDNGNAVNKKGLGFHIPKRFDKILNIDHCYLQPDPSNQIRLDVYEFAVQNEYTFFDLVKQHGFLRNLIIRTANTGQIMVILQVAENNKEQLVTILDFIREKHPAITSLNYVINNKGNETFHDLEVVNYSGKPYVEKVMPKEEGKENLTFKIGPKSFYQTNSDQAYELYKITREFAGLTGCEVVYDLYTGTGTIANFVAHRAKKVIGLEYIDAAIEDAKNNASINEIDNVDFYAGDMKDVLNAEFISKHGKPDVIITDPPRAGMHQVVIDTILAAGPMKIVYVSCNPATQARDLALLDKEYS